MRDIDVARRGIKEVAGPYHRLVLLFGPSPAELVRSMDALSARLECPVISLNAELSEALLDIPRGQRPMAAAKLAGDIVLFDPTDILFSPALRLDALTLLKTLSRNKTVVATWSGTAEGEKLRHAQEWHPEYQYQAIQDIKVVTIDVEGYSRS